jgi:hypothetical protein
VLNSVRVRVRVPVQVAGWLGLAFFLLLIITVSIPIAQSAISPPFLSRTDGLTFGSSTRTGTGIRTGTPSWTPALTPARFASRPHALHDEKVSLRSAFCTEIDDEPFF